MKKEKGITLIALVITIIVLLILASIATYSGISTIKSSKLNKFKQELEIMQAQVQILYEKYKDKDTIDIGKDINSSGREEEANTAFNGAEETEKAGYRLFDKEEIQKLGIDGIERDYLLDIMRRKVICLQGFEYNETIYYTLEQLTDKNVIKDGIERGDVTFEYTTEELSDGGWKVTVYNIKFSKYVGKGIIQYKDTSTGKVTTVETNAKEGESYEFTINSEGNYDVIVTDAAEVSTIKTITLGGSYGGIYSEEGLEDKIASEDIFLYEIISKEEGTGEYGLPNSTARIIGMNPKYCNSNSYYNIETEETYSSTNYDIIFEDGTKLTDTLVIPYQKEIDGEMYRITEVSLFILGGSPFSYLPNVQTIIYPNTVNRIYRYNGTIIYDRLNDTNETINNIVLPNNLQIIDIGAFSLCTNLKSITIPNTVQEIGKCAFYLCKSLTEIEIPSSVTIIGDYAFGYCSSITRIEIPSSVTSIGRYTFSNCTELKNIKIPSSITSIGNSAFSYCSSLTGIEIPNSVISIEDSAFSYCSNITSIEIPNSVTSIGDQVFYHCTSLISISVDIGNTIYDSRDNCNAIIKTTTNELIQGCKNTIVPSNVTSIGAKAFSGYSSLTNIEIPSSVTTIGSYAFSNCEGLTNIEIPNSVTSIGSYAFSNCESLTNITIPSSVTNIENGAFYYCIRLTSIEISSSVTSIGSDAFEYCISLTNITIPNSVTSIGDYAFSGCSSLTNVTIPSNVTSMGDYVFYNWTSSQTINIQFKENEIPSGWDEDWNYKCSAKINYLQ